VTFVTNLAIVDLFLAVRFDQVFFDHFGAGLSDARSHTVDAGMVEKPQTDR
jgi:hypothetical protein